MNDFEYVYGPVPSRRLGMSLGISPIPKKTCNYSCVYCQLGRTDKLTNERKMFFKIEEIMAELEKTLTSGVEFDVVTIVGEGEPTLYLGLGELIHKTKLITKKPVAVITNGSLLYDSALQFELESADIVLPSLDAYDEASFRKVNRPHGKLHFDEVYEGLKDFSLKYSGQLWVEIMLILGLYDDNRHLWYIGHVGTGKLTKQEWRELSAVLRSRTVEEQPFVNRPQRHKDAHWVKPELTVKVKYTEWPKGHSLRQPSIQGFVDVEAEQCVLPTN